MKQLLLILFILIFLPLLSLAQEGKIMLKGRIVSSATNEAIPGAAVSIARLGKQTITNERGAFEIQGLPTATVRLDVSHIAYKKLQKTVTLAADNSELIIALDEALIMSEEIVVSAGFFTTREQTAYKVESVGAKDIARQGTHSMMEALTFVPGVTQVSFGPAIGKPVIRGLSFSRIMTVYQGVRFENQQWGEDHGLGLNDPSIDRVEVVKGPASLMYGSGAIGGVINIIDEEIPSERLSGFAGLSLYSNTLGARSELGLRGAGKKGFFWGLSGNLQSHADYIDGTNRIIGNARFRSAMAKASAGMHQSWGTTRFSYIYNRQLPGIIDENEMEETLATRHPDRSLQLPFQEVTDHLLSSQTHIKMGSSGLRINLGYHVNLREENETSMKAIDLGLRLTTASYDVRYNFFLTPAVELIGGVQGFYQSNTNMEGAGEILLPDSRQWDKGLYGLMMANIGRLSLQGGLRYDHRQTTANARRLAAFELPGAPVSRTLTKSFSGFTASAGATYQLQDNLLLRTNLASGFRAPDLAELFSNGEHPGTNRFERGNAAFGREQNLEWDLSALYRLRSISFEAAAYFNHIRNYIFFSPTEEYVDHLWVWQFEQDDVQLWGGEAGINWEPEDLPWLVNKLSFSMVRGERLGQEAHLPLIPADRIMNELRFERSSLAFFGAPYASVRLQHIIAQHRAGRFEEPTAGYTLTSAGAGGTIDWRKSKLELNVVVQNLFNVAYMDHLAVTRAFGVRNMGRNVTLGVKMPF